MLASERGEPAPLDDAHAPAVTGQRCRARNPGRGPALARRGLADRVEDRRAAPHLHRPPLPGRRHRRLHVPGLAAVPGDVPPRRGAARLSHRADPALRPPGPRRRRRHRHPPGPARHRPRLPHAGRGLARGRRLRRAVRAGPQRPAGLRRQRRHRLLAGHRGTGRAGVALPRHPLPRALGRLLHRGALRAAGLPRPPDRRRAGRRGRLPLRPAHPGPHLRHRRAHRGQRRRPHRARRAGRVELHAHPDPDAGRPAGRPIAAAGRARAQRGLRRRRRPGRRGDRDRARERSSPSSAPTAPASRRCCGPSAGWSRPTTAPSSSTGATSPTCRPTRSPASAWPRCPAARGSSPTCAWRTTCASRPGRAAGVASTTPT